MNIPYRIRKALLALSLTAGISHSGASAQQWQLVAPKHAQPQQQPKAQGLSWQAMDSQTSSASNGIVWELVPPGELTDPAVAAAAQAAREKAYANLQQSLSSPFRPSFYTAYLGGAQPTAYVEQWGQGFIAGYGGLPNEVRDFNFESNLNLGLGLGDPDRLLAITAGWDIGSTKNFNANGSFNIRAGRVLMETPRLQVSAGGGVIALAPYGNESGEDPTNGYGVITFATPLRPGRPDFAQLLQFSFGIGGNDYAPAPDGFPEEEMGYFFALGMQVSPRIGLSIGRSGRGANAVMSVLPNTDLPFYVEMLAVDLFSETPGGTKGVFGIRFGGRNLYRPQGH
jgi:hypothetical protein